MILEEIRPLLVAALIGLAVISVMRNRYQKDPVRIPVRFEGGSEPRRISIRRLDKRAEK
jgi:hypothetical protein